MLIQRVSFGALLWKKRGGTKNHTSRNVRDYFYSDTKRHRFGALIISNLGKLKWQRI